MKTITKTIQAPQLEIRHDDMADNPRTFEDSIGYFVTKANKYQSPDGTDNPYYDAMIQAEEVATDTQSHMEEIKRILKDDHSIRVTDIYPVSRYEHSGVVYKLGEYHNFDTTPVGFYIVSTDTIEGKTHTQETIDKGIQNELETYNAWLNGEVYEFTLWQETDDGLVSEDFSGGFYSLEDIKAELPDEWQDEDLSEYIIYN